MRQLSATQKSVLPLIGLLVILGVLIVCPLIMVFAEVLLNLNTPVSWTMPV